VRGCDGVRWGKEGMYLCRWDGGVGEIERRVRWKWKGKDEKGWMEGWRKRETREERRRKEVRARGVEVGGVTD